MEMEMFKDLVSGHPTTADELLQTGLLEGYSVFYDGGERMCITAYLLREWKSLLDVVKEVRVCPNMTLEEAVQSYAGPAPVKKSVICQKCNGSFLAPFVAKVKLLCSSCKIAVNSEVGATRAKFRLSRRSSAPKLHGNALARLSKRSSSFKRGTPSGSVQSKSSSKITRKDQGMHKLVFDDGGLPDGTKLAYYAHGEALKSDQEYYAIVAIFCYMYIYTSNGVSLHEFTVSVLKGGKRSIKESDDRCIVCARGGKLVLCDACPRAFHKECASLSSVRCNKWYCTYCEKMFRRERHAERSVNAVAAGAEELPDSSLDILKKKKNMVADAGIDVRWMLLRGKDSSREDRALLSQVVAIFHECFDPIIDSEIGCDLIPPMVYGYVQLLPPFNGHRGQYKGPRLWRIVLCNFNSELNCCVSGDHSIFGQDIAELPLAATHTGYQCKGYFQILYDCIVKLLAFFHVKTLVLPAADNAKPMWTNKFGFKEIPEVQLENYKQTCWQMITFDRTSMLQKPVPNCRIINQEQADSDVPLQ
ncbi:UNVERIFIED_CONTAM: hypothetical protein Scaly_1969000 [Sesamum calycinum]|uniref:Histone acetyltransferase n=1 Tax=Sesamum calycinum TaxID=2727403 RepID=A0AAW2N1X4_9LAMI